MAPARRLGGLKGLIDGTTGRPLRQPLSRKCAWWASSVPTHRPPGRAGRLSTAVRDRLSVRSEGPLDGGTDATVSYRSSDPSVVQVDSRGVFTGVKTGGADVIVTYDDLTATVPVFVCGPMRAVL